MSAVGGVSGPAIGIVTSTQLTHSGLQRPAAPLPCRISRHGGSGFSVESPEGVRFLARIRVFTDEEVNEFAKTPVYQGAAA